MSRSSKNFEKSYQEDSSSEDEQSVASVRSVSGSECSAVRGRSSNVLHTHFGIDMDSSSVRSSTSSSSGSIAMAKKSCSKRRRICRMSTGAGTSPRRIVPPARKLVPEVIELSDSEEEVVNEEEQQLIDIFDDDDDEDTYKDLKPADMECLICERKFKQKQQFILHHRRHIALEHFQCPTCSQGFTSLSLCLQHEIKMHRGMNNKKVMGPTGQSKTATACSDDDQDENWLKVNKNRVTTSNHLMMYRGPEVKHYLECFDIEERNGYRNSGLTPMQEQMRDSREKLGLPRPGPPTPRRIHEVN